MGYLGKHSFSLPGSEEVAFVHVLFPKFTPFETRLITFVFI
jgi:hypothetical protein